MTLARHSNLFVANCLPIRAINMNMENAKNVAPIATFPRGKKNCERGANTVGRSNIPCARRDNAPAASKRVFLYESRAMIFKRIAQKRFFFYRALVIYMTSRFLLGYLQL
jgi:hypothetical protein